MNKPRLVLLLVVFLSNLVQGMFLIGVSKSLYELTGSNHAFAGIFIVQLFLQIAANVVAGLIVDSFSVQRILVLVSAGLSLVFGLTAVAWQYSLAPLFFASLLMVIVAGSAAIFHVGLFALVGQRLSSEAVAKFYGEQALAVQIGQIGGGALVGALIYQGSALQVLYLIAAIYVLLAGLFARGIAETKHGKQPEERLPTKILVLAKAKYRRILADFFLLLGEAKVRKIMALSTLPYLLVYCLNISLVPMVEHYAQGNALFLSWYDSSFALGALLGGLSYRKWRQALTRLASPFAFAGVTVSYAALFKLFAYAHLPAFAYLLPLALLGVFSTVYCASLNVALQACSSDAIRGSTAAAQQSCSALLAALVVPGFNRMLINDVAMAWQVPSLVVVIFCLFQGKVYRK